MKPYIDMKTYPLLNAQKRIWFAQKKYEKSPLYNIGSTIKINGYIDTNILSQAIYALIRNNNALRLQFIEENNDVSQYV